MELLRRPVAMGALKSATASSVSGGRCPSPLDRVGGDADPVKSGQVGLDGLLVGGIKNLDAGQPGFGGHPLQ
jgi:hypothetical protein